MFTAAETRLTPQAYLELERKAKSRSEYLNGRVYAMSGASREHNRIAYHLAGQLYLQLQERPCEVYVSDMRVKVDATGLYTYPDLMIACGEPIFEDAAVDTLINPTVLFEILSPSTETYDRGEKFAHYRSLASLSDYVLVAQNRVSVEHYRRQSGPQWLLTVIEDIREALTLDSISCRIPLSAIYAGLTVPSSDPTEITGLRPLP